ncbi:hypothetical protein [Streptomyces longwoodensis]|uniref:hypothetical protein n=1 Tax=Streptomyces longwoodensis TaxID=68231 RepID=UPI003408889C
MAGRPMKPIPADAPAAIREFVGALREFVQDAAGDDGTVSRIAEWGSLSKSTFMGALSGQRMPTHSTVQGIVDAVAKYKSLRPRAWKALLTEWSDRYVEAEQRLAAERVSGTLGGAVTVYDAQVVTAEFDPTEDAGLRRHKSGIYPFGSGDAARTMGKKYIPLRDDATAADVEVAEASALLDQALRRLEKASEDVARAREMLQQALSRESSKRQWNAVASGAAPEAVGLPPVAPEALAELRTLDSRRDEVLRRVMAAVPFGEVESDE